MNWYPVNGKEAGPLLLVFLMSGIFSYVQQYFVSPDLRPFTYIFFLFLLLLAYFPIVSPANPLALARFLSVVIGTIFTVMILVGEIIVRQNYSWGSIVVISGAFLCPLAAGWFYHLTVGSSRR